MNWDREVLRFLKLNVGPSLERQAESGNDVTNLVPFD
jgi:hypothetical protein